MLGFRALGFRVAGPGLGLSAVGFGVCGFPGNLNSRLKPNHKA